MTLSTNRPELNKYNLLGQTDLTHQHSLAAGYPSARTTAESTLFRRIGAGHCGSVWTPGDASFVLKRADGAETRYLWKEYYMQTRLLEALARMGVSAPTVRVPQCYWFTNESDDEWWSKQLPQFPALRDSNSGALVKQQPSNAMCSERIPPVANEFRDRLIDKYCPGKLQENIRQSEANSDCIARLYLGRSRRRSPANSDSDTRPTREPLGVFSLRNCPIRLDQAKELDLPIYQHAEAMADALAAMHWEAEIDANDVEFVLGSPRAAPRAKNLLPSSTVAKLRYNSCTRWQELSSHVYTSQETEPNQCHLWLLDFDCCSIMTMDDEGIECAVSAFYRNDPYYPRPCSPGSEDFQLWNTFKTRYLASSSAILGRRNIDGLLGDKFINRLVEKWEKPKQERYAPHMSQESKSDSLFYKCFVPQASQDVGKGALDELSAYFEKLS